MKLDDHLKHKLQTCANRVLALDYDGSGDMWHYVTVFDQEYGLNIWSADEWGDGSTKSGLRITVYPCHAVTGATIFDQYDNLHVEPIAHKICKLRLKLKGRE
jgi:hypothetical protein